MSRFAYILKHGAQIDLFVRPFWKAHADWRTWFFPPYAEWIGFGDQSEAWQQTWLGNADLVELIDAECEPGAHARYVREFRERAARLPERTNSIRYSTSPMAFFAGFETNESGEGSRDVRGGKMLMVFPDTGWASIRTDRNDPEHDLAFFFRSSPYGSISHSHANNNDFIIHVAGTVMSMPSGYYSNYGSPHHVNWVWHTKSHNCATLSGASQKMRSHASRGAVANSFENDHLAYVVGIADDSYDCLARRYRRHVLFLKSHHAFVLIDEFEARPGIQVSYEWNIHTWHKVLYDDKERTFLIEADGSDPLGPKLLGTVMYRQNCFFTPSVGWDPPPHVGLCGDERQNQFHLRFSTGNLVEELRLPVVIRADWKSHQAPAAQWRKDERSDTMIFPDTTISVPRAGSTIARISSFGKNYTIDDRGLF